MKHYAGIDLSMETTHVCVVDVEGRSRRDRIWPCVDGPPLARDFLSICTAGWCGHVFDL